MRSLHQAKIKFHFKYQKTQKRVKRKNNYN